MHAPNPKCWSEKKREREESGVGLGIGIGIERFVACMYVCVCKYNKETVRTVSGEEKCGTMKNSYSGVVVVGSSGLGWVVRLYMVVVWWMHA